MGQFEVFHKHKLSLKVSFVGIGRLSDYHTLRYTNLHSLIGMRENDY